MKKKTILNLALFIFAFIIIFLKHDTICAEFILGLDMGESYNLVEMISDYNEMVNYSIDDNFILSMDSNGVVTGLQPGSTVVTIRYLDYSNNTQVFESRVDVNFVP